jgi:CBS domain-containing protein
MAKQSEELHGLDLIAKQVERGKEPEITGRELLGWYGATRRGSRVVARIRGELRRRNLMTQPDFNEVWVDIPIRVRAMHIEEDPPETEEPEEKPSSEHIASETSDANDGGSRAAESKKAERVDPVHRIGRLLAPNKEVIYVSPGTSLNEATTLMMLKDFSQLPVLHGEWTCKGAVSWQSIAIASALGKACKTVDDCLVPAEVVEWNAALLEVIPKIVEKGFVLVRAPDKTFRGIVTVADLSLQFRMLSEPFMLLGQIENLLRILIDRSFTLEELRTATEEAGAPGEIKSVFDLTFGGYVRVLERTDIWPKLGVSFDRAPFLKDLDEVRTLRNDVMHFSPDPLEDSDLALLRNVAAFLERVV